MNTDARTSPTPPHAEFFPPPRLPRAPARWLAILDDDRKQLVRFWPVVQNMVVQDLRVRYQRSVLGFFWTLLNPVLMMITFTVVFSQLLATNWKDYLVYLFAGMVPWALLQTSLSDCTFCIIHNEGLIRKIFLPKLIFPLVRVLISLVTMVLSMAALFLVLLPMGARFSAPMLALPVAIALFAVFSLGLGLIVATINTFYRDFSHLVSVILQAWYFATPILYYSSQFDKVPWMLWLNPAYPFIRLFQTILCGEVGGRIEGPHWPALSTFALAASIAAASLGVGYAIFKSYEDKLVFRL